MNKKIVFILSCLIALLGMSVFIYSLGLPNFTINPEDAVSQPNDDKLVGIENQSKNIPYQQIDKLFVKTNPTIEPTLPLKEPSADDKKQGNPIVIPRFNYIGSIGNETGVDLFFLKNDNTGELIKIGKGVDDGNIIFIKANKETIDISIDGKIVTIPR